MGNNARIYYWEYPVFTELMHPLENRQKWPPKTPFLPARKPPESPQGFRSRAEKMALRARPVDQELPYLKRRTKTQMGVLQGTCKRFLPLWDGWVGSEQAPGGSWFGSQATRTALQGPQKSAHSIPGGASILYMR